jgi:hypothetical protein
VEGPESRPAAQSPGSNPPKVERRIVGAPVGAAPEPHPKRAYKPDPAWDKVLLVVGVLAAIAAVLVVPGIVNRGGQNPVAAAAEATSNASGVRINFYGRMDGPVGVALTGKGLLNGETDSASIGMTATGSTSAGVQGFALQEIVSDGDVYISSPQLGQAFGSPARWLLMRSEAFGDLLKGNSAGGPLASPTQQLDALQDASSQVTEVGRERVDGVATTHYSAVLDIGKLTDQLKDQVSGNFQDLIEKAMEDVSGGTVDVWIGADGLLRRETSSSTDSAGTFTMTMEFSDYGIHPNIQPPPSSEVYDATPLMQRALDEISG